MDMSYPYSSMQDVEDEARADYYNDPPWPDDDELSTAAEAEVSAILSECDTFDAAARWCREDFLRDIDLTIPEDHPF